MTTLTVVKKGQEVAIAADGLTTFGDTRLARSYKGEHDKILDLAGSRIGICGSSAHHLVLQVEEMVHLGEGVGMGAAHEAVTDESDAEGFGGHGACLVD